MGQFDLYVESTEPSSPPAGYLRFFHIGTTLRSKDSSGTVVTYSTGITQEQVEDYVGNLLTDSSTVNVTYNDAGNQITFDVIASAVNHDALLNFVANEHIDHSSVSITAGTGLTGGGDLTATRTISMPNTGTAGTYKSVTTDAQGRVTAGTNPTTLSGFGITDAQPLDGDLTALSGLTGTGVIARTAVNTMTTRTITAGTGISLANGDGVSGNPTITNSDSGSAAVSTHVGLSDPHAQYELEANLAADVRNTTLSGFVSGPASTVLDTDSVLAAFQKLQAQVNAVSSASEWTELSTFSTYTNSSNTTGVVISELSFPVTAGNNYYLELTVLYQTATTGTGFAITMTSPDGASAPGALQVNVPVNSGDGTAYIHSGTINSLGDYVTSPSTQAANTPFVLNAKGVFPCNTSGTFVPTFRSESNGNTVTVLVGTTMLLREFTP